MAKTEEMKITENNTIPGFVHTFINHSHFVADKFIRKVESGRVRSKETYRDMCDIKEEAEYLKVQLGLNRGK